jgi:hypothetical protein
MPLWTAWRGAGLRNAWLLGMAVLAFMWALGLGRGDLLGFAWSALTGLALAATQMPSALLAALADAGHAGRRRGVLRCPEPGHLLNLALAAGLALPMLARLGYARTQWRHLRSHSPTRPCPAP